MGSADRRHRHRASLRRHILDAASALFVEDGYERVTMRRVASRIEYSPTTIYLHFKNKQDLFDAVCNETFAELAARLERLRQAPNTPLGSLRDGLKLYVEFGVAHPDHYAVTFMQRRRAPARPGDGHPVGLRAFDLLRQAVRACRDRGDIQIADVDVTAQALWAAAHGLTALLISERDFPVAPRQALIDHTLDVLMAGLGAPGQAPAAKREQRPPRRPAPFSFMD